jgi:hypothetical protein
MITPKIPLLKDGQILSVDVVNSIIKRTEYAGDLLKQYKLIAGNEMYVEPHYDGTRVSYLQPVGGGGGEAGAGGDSTPGVMASGYLVSANLGINYPPPIYIYKGFFVYYDSSSLPQPPSVTTQLFPSGVYSANTDFKPAFDGSFDGAYVASGFNLTITSSSGQLLLSVNGPKIVNNVYWINNPITQLAFGTSIIGAYWSAVDWYAPANGLAGGPAGQVLTVSRSRRTEFGVGVPNQFG